jgi:hypothetical protein
MLRCQAVVDRTTELATFRVAFGDAADHEAFAMIVACAQAA